MHQGELFELADNDVTVARAHVNDDFALRKFEDRLRREFMKNLTNPGTRLEHMGRSSTDLCRWRCSTEGCGHEWSAKVQFRARKNKPTGCPKCWERRNRAPGPGESLADVNPDLAKQFVRNLTRPGRGPDTFRHQAHDRCEWACPVNPDEHVFPATVANRTNGRGCPECSAQGRSKFEVEIAMLVEAASGLEVKVDHRVRLKGRRLDRFDLFVPEVPLVIDLDPKWSHGEEASLVRDTAKTRAALAAGFNVERIRESGLPPIPIDGFTHHEAGSVVDREGWAEAVGYVLRRYGRPWKDLDPAQVRQALTAASALWYAAVAKPDVSALDEAPHLAKEFVENLTNPSRGLDRMTPGCNDECRWACSAADCDHTWTTALSTRTLRGSGCDRCARRKNGVAKSVPGRGESLAERRPDLAAQLIEVIDRPELTAWDLFPQSNYPCQWKCPNEDCGHEWPAQPSGRVSDGRGCPPCSRKRTVAAVVRPKPGKSLADKFPQIAAELVEVVDHPGWTAVDLKPSSTKQCRWKCSKLACPGAWDASPDQRTRRNGTGMRCPECFPPRQRQSSS
ncbi:zinc-ribbon domain-containing protein [Streptomyces sp. NPDC051162]|uniref:zinc-ribbon domain-containing protein n=1 Tax=unclassified Streptomyces TaxID=2593676 RepID=UPI003416AA44